MEICIAIKKGGVQCTYKAKFGCYCGVHNKHLFGNPEEPKEKIPDGKNSEEKKNLLVREIAKLEAENVVLDQVVVPQPKDTMCIVNRGTGAGGSYRPVWKAAAQ